MSQTAEQVLEPATEADADAAETAALQAIWNKNERDNGAAREEGKFVSPDPEKRAEAEVPAPEQAEEPAPEVAAVPLPPSWQGMEKQWEQVPPEVRADIARKEQENHRRMSEQGRQLTGFKPLADVIQKNSIYFDGRFKGEDGKPITPAQGIEYLFNVQRSMDSDPVGTLLQIADRYGVRDQLAPTGAQPAQAGDKDLLREIAGLRQMLAQNSNPAVIREQINQTFEERASMQAAAEEVSRLAKDKPLYSEIPEERFVRFIHDARAELGDSASKQALFDLAYDMAVHADPKLRARAAAARPAADPARIEGAKKAAGVNVTSTASGKGRVLTEDEELLAAYNRAQQKG